MITLDWQWDRPMERMGKGIDRKTAPEVAYVQPLEFPDDQESRKIVYQTKPL
jgi:hypothetical protein